MQDFIDSWHVLNHMYNIHNHIQRLRPGTWRRTISKAACSFESSRRSAIAEKRLRGGKTVQPQHQNLTRPLPAVTATGLVDPA